MNIGKSIQIALITKGANKKQLSDSLGVRPEYVTVLCKRKYCSKKMMDKLCEVFEMKASEFVALGE